jgi:hypothetical protein
MRGIFYLDRLPVAYSEEQSKYFRTKFARLCRKAITGNRNDFDKFCQNIYPFCMELYEVGKDLRFDPKIFEGFPGEGIRDLPRDMALGIVHYGISVHILPIYKNYLTKSEAFYEMLCQIINEEKFGEGRDLFILTLLPKAKRSDGIDFKRLLQIPITGGWTIAALLKLKDGRFVDEAIQYLKRFPKDHFKKQITRYIERYS